MTDNVKTNFLVDRLKMYITIRDVCIYIGIDPISLSKLNNINPDNEWKKENERDKLYHLKKLKYFIIHGIDKPIDIDSMVYKGKQLAIPVILDGRHRYLAAILRRDKTISVTYSGRQDLMNFLSGKSNRRPTEIM